MLFASAAMAAWALVATRGPRTRLPPRAALFALASGVCFGTDLAMWNTSLVRTSVATATLLVNTTPIHVGLYARLVLGERLSPRFVAGAGLALGGAALLLGISRHDLEQTEGALLALAAALFYAGYLLCMKSARSHGDAAPALLLSNLGATAVLGLYALAGREPMSGFPAASWAAMAATAAVSQLGGVFAIVWALRYLSTTVASVGLLAQPVCTALLGWWILGEPLSPPQAAGGAVVLLGIALASRAGGAGRVEAREGPAERDRRVDVPRERPRSGLDGSSQATGPRSRAPATTGRTPGDPSTPSS
jgi:drug/metabolite transporter (DMT)-like permease